MYPYIANKNPIFYQQQQYGVVPNQYINQYPRPTLEYNPQIQNVKNVPIIDPRNQAYIQASNVYNIPLYFDSRKTFTPGQYKLNKTKTQMVVNEGYRIDPLSERRLKTAKRTQKDNAQLFNNTTQNFATNNNYNILLTLNNQEGALYKNQKATPKYQIKTVDPQSQKKKILSSYNELYSNYSQNLNNSNFQEKNPQNIENLTSTIFNSQIVYPQNQIYNKDNNKKIDLKKSATSMTVQSLASIPYNEYPTAEFSQQPFSNIAGYGLNSYNGKVKKFNEDRTKAIVNYKLNKNFTLNGIQYREPCISYFSIFDGHAGKKCSDFLRQNLDTYLFNSPYFPSNPVKAIFETFKKAENDFYAMAYDAKNNILLDKSGSCALIILIIDNLLYAINLGDSRALYSYNGGSSLFQITRDHKPNDEIERKRIEKVGGKVYYANTITRNGKEIKLKEEDFGKGFSFPYRVFPGKIAVSISI
jgi:hypothetical protein